MSITFVPGRNARAIRRTSSLGGVEVVKNAQVTVQEHGDDTGWFTARLQASSLILPVEDFEPVDPPEPFTAPAPLDPSKVKAGDTVVLTGPTGRATVSGPVSAVSYVGGGEWDIRIEDASTYRVGRLGLWAVTAHQPAPKPEWKPGTTGTATVDGHQGIRVMRVKDAFHRDLWASSLLDGELLHHDEDVTEFVPDETRPLPTALRVAEVICNETYPTQWSKITNGERVGLLNAAEVVLALLRGESR